MDFTRAERDKGHRARCPGYSYSLAYQIPAVFARGKERVPPRMGAGESNFVVFTKISCQGWRDMVG